MEEGPRHSTRDYFIQQGIEHLKLVRRVEFDRLFDNGDFSDGPFRCTFGDGYGEPYYPNRQAFGMITGGEGVYCELTQSVEEEIFARRKAVMEKEEE